MLQIRLLGQFDVRLDGKRIVISSRAGQSLLAYLVMTAGTPHRREKLAGTLWPDSSEENARKNLRQELWRIRKAIPAQNLPEADDYLIADEYTLTFNRGADYWLDVSILENSDPDIQSLTSGLSLYQGELLPGFYDDWVVLERERLQTLFETKMEKLVEKLVESERWAAVQEQCERWLALGFVSEAAYRALMLSHNARGDMAKVSAIYQRCVEDLRDHFGVEPSAETHALFNGLLKGAKVPRRILPAQPSGTVTFLFTDIQGSTRLLDKLGDQYAISLQEHHRILRAAIQKWKGTEMDTQGDAFFVTFTRALDAVQCAAEAQRELSNHAWLQDEAVRVRMGLHTGEPLIASTGYVGMDVHRAARIGDAGHGGQVLLSQTTRDLVLQDLPPGITIKELGEHRLKDMKYPTPIYQLVIEGLQAEFPPLKMKFTGSEVPVPGDPPFKGLQYFEESDSDLFFGRELLTAKLVRRLQDTQFLSVVIGASGSGKSSLVRAGLIPALKKGSTLLDGTEPPAGSTDWQVHILTPTAHPLEALATELTRELGSVVTTAQLIDDLAQEPRSLSLFLARGSAKRHTVLVVDQFEELFTLCRDEFEREAFIDNLLNLVSPGQSSTTLIITLRADFYAHLAQYPELRDAVAQQQEYIGPMTAEELRLAIEEPARRGHWEFEPGLADLILRDVGEEPGALPLLSHALLETWKRRAGHTLTLKGYADAGGVHGAIAHTAESIYQNLPPEEQAIARDIFLRLTELGEGTEDTRRRASFGELLYHTENTGEVRHVLNRLAEARLITLGEDTVEVAHEALIREWPTLREWLNQDREGLRLHRHLTEAAYEWELLGRDSGALYRGAHLAQAREWAALHPNSLNIGEREFLAASINQEQHEHQEREEQQKRELESARKLAENERARAEEQSHSANRLRTRNRVITTVGSVAVILALVAGLFGMQSNQNARQAETNLSIADQQRVTAQSAQATAMAESQVRATQQAIAETNFTQAEAQRLAAEATKLILSQGSPEQIALLSLRSMNIQYTPQGDAALAAAATLEYPKQLFGNKELYWSNGVAFSADSKYVVVGNGPHATLWDAETGESIRKFTHGLGVTGIACSLDGKFILTGGWNHIAILWDAATGAELQRFIGHNDVVWSVAISPDGNRVLTGSYDGTARLWDTATGNQIYQFISHADIVRSVAFSHDGKHALLGKSDGGIDIWDARTGTVAHQFTGSTSSVNSVAFSPEDKLILAGGNDLIARLWDATTGEELQSFIGHINAIESVAFSPDGKYVFTSSDDGTARKWDPQSGQELQRFIGPASVRSIASMPMAVSPDGKSLVTASSEGETRLWNINPTHKLPVFKNGTVVNDTALSSDGKHVLTGDTNGTVRMWDAVTGEKLRDFIGHTDGIGDGVVFSPNGKYILSGSWDNTVRLWDIQTGKELRKFIGPAASVYSVAFSPDGKYVMAGGVDGVWLWITETGEEVLQLKDADDVIGVAFSNNGKYIGTAGGNSEATSPIRSEAYLWDTSNGQLIRSFRVSLDNLNSIDFSPDGKYIVVGSVDNIAQVWDIQTGFMVHPFLGHTAAIWSTKFSPDGKYIVTASADSTVRIWNVQTGHELRYFIGHTAGVNSVNFSSDGKYLLTGSDDGTARLWDVDYHTTIDYLCSILLRDFTHYERTQYGITDNDPTCPAR
jgi:WD40 repeat protein/class 3 adenylate cyclase